MNSTDYDVSKDPGFAELRVIATRAMQEQITKRSPKSRKTARVQTLTDVDPDSRAESKGKKRTVLNDCEVLGVLGEGTFGLVLLLKHSRKGLEYALKGMSKEHLKQEGQEDMVQNERRMMLALDSPFITHLYSTFE